MTAGRNQYLCSLIMSIPSFMTSFGIVWPSYTIDVLEGDSTPLSHKISKQEASCVGSLPMLGSFMVSLFVGYLSDCIGRKKSELLCGLLITLAWAIITTAKTSTQVLIGRFIFGSGFGIHFVVALVYTGEMAHPSTTGSATSILMFATSIGALGSYLAGWFCSYEVICYLNLSLGVVFVVAISFMRETPAFLIGKGKDKEAFKSLKFYRAASTNTEDILEEYNYIKSQRMVNNMIDSKLKQSQIPAENEKLNQAKCNKDEKELNAWKLLLTSKPSQRALVFLSAVIMLTICMGMVAVQAYAGPFFSMAVPGMSPHLCSVVLAIVLTVSSGLAVAITDLFRRRILLLSSLFLSSCALALLGSQLRWAWAPNWIVPLLMVFFCISFQLGANNVPLVQAVEIFRPEIRGVGTQLLISFLCITNFVVLFLYGSAVNNFGLDCTFFIFSLIGVIATIFTYFTMRETRGVSLERVQEMFENGYLYRKIDK